MGDAATNLVAGIGINTETYPAEVLQDLKAHFIAGWAGYPASGTKEQVVGTLQGLSDAGLDGALLSWARYEEGMTEFMTGTYPLVRQAGLRS